MAILEQGSLAHGVLLVATLPSVAHDTTTADVELRVRRAYHELRSPTALIVTVARHALDEHDPARARSALELIERIADRTLNRVSTVLDASAAPAFRRPSEFLRQLASDSVRCGLPVELIVDGGAANDEIRHEPAAFEALAQALVENAYLHGDPARPIVLRLERAPDGLSFSVTNHCADHDLHVGQRIGLPLAHDLAERMRGVLRTSLHAGVYQVQLSVPTA